MKLSWLNSNSFKAAARRLQERSTKNRSRLFWLIILAVVVLAVAGLALAALYTPTLLLTGQPVEVEIPEGASVKEIAKILKKEKVIFQPSIFVLYVWAKDHETALKAGTYEFPENANLVKIESMMAQGLAKYKDVQITVFEGSNIWETDRWLVSGGLIKPGEFAAKYYEEEGYLFPDTYRFKVPTDKFKNLELKTDAPNGQDKLETIAQKLRDNFKTKTEELLGDKSDQEKDRILTIASMLEKEARTFEDMQKIAGIIEKRLELGMKLEIDAAVAYGWCLRQSLANNFGSDCKVSEAPIALELKKDSPYNTYRNYGLPPAPIANPGIKAIAAALHPLQTPYLFYLSPRDGSTIIYSKNGAEHAANRRKYLGL